MKLGILRSLNKFRYLFPVIYVVVYSVTFWAMILLTDSGLGDYTHIIGNNIFMLSGLITLPVWLIPFLLTSVWPVISYLPAWSTHLFLLVPISILFVVGCLLDKILDKIGAFGRS
jgi:hypothetical protein